MSILGKQQKNRVLSLPVQASWLYTTPALETILLCSDISSQVCLKMGEQFFDLTSVQDL